MDQASWGAVVAGVALVDWRSLNPLRKAPAMNSDDVKAEAVGFQLVTFFKGEPPARYLAFQLVLQDGSGAQSLLPWLALAPGLAAQIAERIQTSLANPHPDAHRPADSGSVH